MIVCRTLPLLLTVLLSACSDKPDPCIESLMRRDRALEARTDSLMRALSDTSALYRAGLLQLREEERRLFSDVAGCDFGKNLTAYNYWHRGRLKFPGKIEQELFRLHLNEK